MQVTKTQLTISLEDNTTGINTIATPLRINNHNSFLTDFKDSVFFTLSNNTDDILEGNAKFLSENNQDFIGIKTTKSLLKTEGGVEFKEFSSDNFTTTIIGNSNLTSSVRIKLPGEEPNTGEVLRIKSYIGGIAELEYTSAGVGTINAGTINRLAIHSGGTSVSDSGTGTSLDTTVVLPAEKNKTFNIPVLGGLSNADFILSETNQVINGIKTFSDKTSISNLGIRNSTSEVTVTSLDGSDYSLTLPATQGASNSIVSNNNGSLEFITIDSPGVGSNTGLEINSTNIRLHYANDTQPGILSVNSQLISGEKTFQDDLRIEENSKLILKDNNFELSLSSPLLTQDLDFVLPLDGTSGQFLKTDGAGNLSFETLSTNIVKDGTQFQIPLYDTVNSLNSAVTVGSGVVNLKVLPQASLRNYSITDVGSSADFLMNQGDQTINGVKTFTGALNSSAATNQLLLGSTTINSGLVTPRTYNLPDAGSNADIVLNEGDSIINGSKTFSDTTVFNSNISTGTGISFGLNTGELISFYGGTPIAQQPGLTPSLSSLSQAGVFTSDYNIQTMTDTSPFGFATLDEAETVLSVLINVQTRLNELESRISTLTLIG